MKETSTELTEVIEVNGVKITNKLLNELASFQEHNYQGLDYQYNKLVDMMCKLCRMLCTLQNNERDEVIKIMEETAYLREFFQFIYPPEELDKRSYT